MSQEDKIEYRFYVPWGATAGAVTKSDSTVFDPPARKLYVGQAGDVCLRLLDASVVVLKNVQTGTFIDLQFDQVRSTNTTAALMVALF